MSKSTLFGLAAAAILIGACGSGEIGGLSSDLGPGSPRNGDDLTATLSVSNGSRMVEATEKAYDTLELELMARPGGAQVDAGIAVATQQPVDLAQAPIRVRFGQDGYIDVQDGGQWTNSTMIPYEAYVWYRIKISADVATDTYTVQVEPQYDVKRGPQQQRLRTLVEGATFDRRGQQEKWLGVWGAWSSTDYTLDIAEPSWLVSGRCAPASCASLGAECGVVGDGCGGTLSCGDCDAAQACRGGTCTDLCVPDSCVSLGLECGTASDGCGGTLTCGQCADACVPDTCLSLGVECGAVSDGCGGTLSCGGCASGQACTGGICENVCTPATCASWGVECGTLSDGCGGTLNCGGCPSGEVCSFGSCVSASQPPPSCVPDSCQSLGVSCGAASNGCGGTLSCGGCQSGQACLQGVCQNVCTPRTCASQGVECGTVSDGCGGTLSCGGCGNGQACNAGVCDNVCTPQTCVSLGVECGAASNGCGGTLSCGGCAVGQVCEAGICAASSPPSCSPYTCSEIGASCGAQSDGCGGILSCGSCASGSTCTSGRCVAPGSTTFYATRTQCMAPCAVQLDAQAGASLTWPEVRDSEYVWDFDDGGSRTDAEGFMAAVVYETAGTYRPTVTVDGETWNPKTISVCEPGDAGTICSGGQVRCVSPVSDWTNCPAGAGHYTSLSSALSGVPQYSWVLLEGGRSFGSLGIGSSLTNVMIGAYDAGSPQSRGAPSNPPSVTAYEDRPPSGMILQDLRITSAGGYHLFTGGLGNVLFNHLTTSGNRFGSHATGMNAGFVFNSDLTGDDYGIYLGGGTCNRYVVKNTRLHASQTGNHTFRLQGCNKVLIQDSSITHVNGGLQEAMTLRGDDDWLLIQGNYFNKWVDIKPENSSEVGTNRQWMVFEDNYIAPVEESVAVQMEDVINSVFRNNITAGNATTGFSCLPGGNNNVEFYNNTTYVAGSSTNAAVVRCQGSTCIARNNLAVARPSSTGVACVTGASAESNNWCYHTTSSSSSWCRDPMTGGSTCYNPGFMSTSYGNANLMRPASGSRGVDAGYQNVPVWNDFRGAPRSMIDVGAVEQ